MTDRGQFHIDAVSLRQRIQELEDHLAARNATIAMAVARLGGIVDGQPTHRGNFLQRIDELRDIERELLP